MADKEQVIQALRATLISVKGALTLKQCNRDYRELQGEWIPYKKLGYPTLEKLFQESPGFKINQINGEWYVDAIASQETQHIAAMVAKQKSNKKAPRLSQPSRFPKRQDSWRKPNPSSNYSSNYNDQYSKQYYRAKSATNNNNNYYPKFNSKYSKVNDVKNNHNQTHAKAPKPLTEHVEPTTNNKNNYANNKTEKPAPEVKQAPPRPPQAQTQAPKSTKTSASQRLSNLRDRLKPVDLIPLQLPAVTNECLQQEVSGPVASVIPAHNLELPPDSATPVSRLLWTCQKLGLPHPVYKTHDYKPKRGSVCYDCSVKVGSYTASSYPDSSPSEDLARENAAAKLLMQIESSQTAGLATSIDSVAVANLADLVAEHEAGLWATTVPHLYREKYGENLPSNWQELIENCPRVIKDRVVNGLLVLLPNKDSNLDTTSVDKTFHDMTFYDRTLIEDTLETDLPPLQFPDDSFWNVYVTVANSTIEIWIRIIGPEYSEAYESLLEEMVYYYNHYGAKVEKSMILKDSWCAVNVEGGWQRAKILEIEDDRITVFLGDHGDDEVVLADAIKILEPQFRRLPAQAILCRLEGAEEVSAWSGAGALVRNRLLGEILVAAPGARNPADPAVALVLYDTSTPRDLNLNKEIVQDFAMQHAFTLTQKPCEVEVGCVSDEGRVWVSRAGGAGCVRSALALLTAGAYRRALPAAPHAPPPPAADTRRAPLYIVRTLTGDWVRCVIISGLDGEGTVRTRLVDSGLILRAPLSSLVPLETFSSALNIFPHQAMQVRLAGAERACGSMAARLRELLLHKRAVCRAASGGATGNPPAVELFVRTGPQDMLASVNNAVLVEYDILHSARPKEEEEEEETDHVSALHRKKERIFRSASGPGDDVTRAHGALPPPTLPPLGKCFDVYVAMAANPWNFVVQPNSTRHSLQSMMGSLQTECPKLSELDAPVNPANGELYTVYYEKDSLWYRVLIAGTVSSEMVSVYFCDYGDLALFTTKALRPVPAASRLASSLPPQAIKARLHNVLPLHQDWTVEDCIRFQELCVEQQFVGICKEVGRDPLNPNEPLLTLDLIDTTTDEDIYLNNLLVSEERARLATTPST